MGMSVLIAGRGNPRQLKLFGADGFKLSNDTQKQIEALIETDFTDHLSPPEQCGKAKRLDDALGRYVEHVKSSFPKGETLAGMKIVLDCANGAAYKVAPQIFWELEAEVITIGTQPDGRNINQECGATDLKALQCKVIQEGADIGIALDGDADRLIALESPVFKMTLSTLLLVALSFDNELREIICIVHHTSCILGKIQAALIEI